MAYNQRSQFPSDYVQIANVDTSGFYLSTTDGGTTADPVGDAMVQLVISNADVQTRTVAVFTGPASDVELYRFSVKAGTTLVTPGLKVTAPAALAIGDTALDDAGVYVTAFFMY